MVGRNACRHNFMWNPSHGFVMATSSKVTFEVPPELRKIMDDHPEVNWSAVFRDALMRHASLLEIAKRIAEGGEDRRSRRLAGGSGRGRGGEEEDGGMRRLADGLRRGAGARYRRAGKARRGCREHRRRRSRSS